MSERRIAMGPIMIESDGLVTDNMGLPESREDIMDMVIRIMQKYSDLSQEQLDQVTHDRLSEMGQSYVDQFSPMRSQS